MMQSMCSLRRLLRLQVAWAPSRDVSLGQPRLLRVLPLVSMTLQLLVTHIEDVESLWGLPDVLRVRLHP